MAVYTLRIDSTADWCSLAIQSAGTWARGPGRTLTYQATGGDLQQAAFAVDDREIRLVRTPGAATELILNIQLATLDDRVFLRSSKAANGVVRITSAANVGINDGTALDGNEQDILLYLHPEAATEVGALPGDPSLE